MRSGRFNRNRVRLERPVTAQDGDGHPVVTWTPVKTIPAGVEPLAGREFQSAQQAQSGVTTRIVIRYGSEWAAVDASWRAVDVNSGRVYEIDSVLPDRGRNRMLTLMCREGVSSG